MAKQGQDLGGGLTAQLDPGGGGARVVLSGNVTERAVFKPLLAIGNPLVVDLAGVDRINSLGVRHWVHFVRDAEALGIQLVLDRVSAPMIQQLGMISNFMGSRAKVRSLFVPYLCEACNSHSFHLVDVAEGGAIAVPPSVPCSKCKSPTVVDELLEMYDSLSEILANR